MGFILEAGRLAPTACNYQPQRFYIIKSEKALEKVDSTTRFRFGVSAVILVCYDANVVWSIDDAGFSGPYCSGDQDASIAAASMMFEAEELGIHTLWIRGFDSESVAQTFYLPEGMIPVEGFQAQRMALQEESDGQLCSRTVSSGYTL
ncbi:MAG: nitroreductase family protein [Candidatus Methanomethylophilaceae archaeon]|nr:nitroreductase family protein [Candidatus Methanomethylophilaceae archaeon]